MTATLHLPLFRRGKVRDTYELPGGEHLLMVASDRISAFDVVLPTPVPGKGETLTRLSTFWFAETSGLIPNHLMSVDVPDGLDLDDAWQADLRGRSMVIRRAERIDIECVVRGYLAGSAWQEYAAGGTVAGEPMPAGLRRAERLPAPIFTPAVKHDVDHDVTISPDALRVMVGDDLAARLEEASRDLYEAGAAHALDRGLILADTKFEFGWVDGELTLIDELLTPDSSRFWEARSWEPGTEPDSFDKQFVRNWLLDSGWDRTPPGPELPDHVVAGTVARYRDAADRLIGPAGRGGTA
ncbi:MAG: phosphoribosylaminoimidazolesuccinocarboxamide synthase [Chloroflexia bacterium]|nr:phosphoribosylaminoimidazolesuccinocarboxamide synthase [Chloroflexia bacterium]